MVPSQGREPLAHLVSVPPVRPLWLGSHHQQAATEDRWTWGQANATATRRARVCAHHIGVRGVRQPKRSPVVLPIQRRLFRVQLVQPAADLSTPQQSLAVLRKLQQEEQSLNMTPPPTPPDALITGVNLRRQVPSSRCWSVRGDSGSARFFHQQKPK